MVFKNTVYNYVWVASNPHPTHTEYPGFDAGRPYVKDEEFAFKFMNAGTFGYHNHYDPSQGGTVVVQP